MTHGLADDDAQSLDRGRYRVINVLARRDYASVYEALDTRTDERVAVKVLPLTAKHRDIAEAMFRKEIRALDNFRHEAVVRLLDHFTEPERARLGIVLELVPGGQTLEALITSVQNLRESRKPLRWRIEQLSALLNALDAAHKRNVIHRDVKPANILYDRATDSLRLVDFGIAIVRDNYARDLGTTSPTRTLREFYTRPFAAPEQVLHREASSASDMHAFGLVTASLLSWNTPAPNFKVLDVEVFLEPVRKELHDRNLFTELKEHIERLLAQEPKERPRAHETSLLFAKLLERATDRLIARVRVSATATIRAAEANVTSLIDDLNDRMRARYEPVSGRGVDSFIIRCFGQNAWAVLKPDDSAPEHLIVVDAGRNPPNIHALHREKARAMPYKFINGSGPATDFIAATFRAYCKDKKKEDERRKKESLVAMAEFLLERQRDRLTRLTVAFSRETAHTGAKRHLSDLGEKLAKRTGVQPSATDATDLSGEYISLKVLNVRPSSGDSIAEQELVSRWANDLDNKAVFLFNGRKIASFQSFEPVTRTLTLKRSAQVTLPETGELECKNIAMEAALRRQENAIQRFFSDDCVNANLGRLLLYPEENRLALLHHKIRSLAKFGPAFSCGCPLRGRETQGLEAGYVPGFSDRVCNHEAKLEK